MVFRAAAAAVRITPAFDVELAGYGPYLGRRKEGVHDDLWARSVVLDAGDQVIALVSCDLIGIPNGLSERIEHRVSSALQRTCHVVLCATHTHSGPATVRMLGWGEVHPEYVGHLETALVRVVREAAVAVRPAKLRYSVGAIGGLAYNRERPDGAVDGSVYALWVDSLEGPPLAVIYGFGCHAVVLRDDNRLISADFPGVASHRIANEVGGTCQALFVQAPCGDVDPIPPTQSFEVVRTLGEKLATAVLSLRDRARLLEPVLAFQNLQIELPVDIPDRSRLEGLRGGDPDALKAEETVRVRHLDLDYGAIHRSLRADMQQRWWRLFREWAAAVSEISSDIVRAPLAGLRIADLKLLALPCEMYVELALELRRVEPVPWLVTCAQGYVGYVPDKLAYDRAEYPAVLTPLICGQPPFKSSVGALMLSRLTDILRRL